MLLLGNVLHLVIYHHLFYLILKDVLGVLLQQVIALELCALKLDWQMVANYYFGEYQHQKHGPHQPQELCGQQSNNE